MKAEEKAEELVDKFKDIKDAYYIDEQAKKRALIAVDEIIDSSPMYYTGFEYESNLEYWQEVKQEIEKL